MHQPMFGIEPTSASTVTRYDGTRRAHALVQLPLPLFPYQLRSCIGRAPAPATTHPGLASMYPPGDHAETIASRFIIPIHRLGT